MRRRASKRVARRLGVPEPMIYIVIVGAEAAIGWFVMGQYLDKKLGWSFVAILVAVLAVAASFELLYEYIVAGDNAGRRSGGQ